jgi:hypothetical protein
MSVEEVLENNNFILSSYDINGDMMIEYTAVYNGDVDAATIIDVQKNIQDQLNAIDPNSQIISINLNVQNNIQQISNFNQSVYVQGMRECILTFSMSQYLSEEKPQPKGFKLKGAL